MATTFRLGMQAKAYYAAAATDPTTLVPSEMTEMENVKDVNIDHSTGEADVTTRGNSGFRATAATLKECTVTFQMVWKSGAAAFTAIKNAWLNGTEIALGFITGDAAGDEGPIGNFSITNFSRNEALEDAIVIDVTAKLSAFGSWHTVSGT